MRYVSSKEEHEVEELNILAAASSVFHVDTTLECRNMLLQKWKTDTAWCIFSSVTRLKIIETLTYDRSGTHLRMLRPCLALRSSSFPRPPNICASCCHQACPVCLSCLVPVVHSISWVYTDVAWPLHLPCHDDRTCPIMNCLYARLVLFSPRRPRG